jgi:pyrroloquinoline quinone biosynthesis protein E
MIAALQALIAEVTHRCPLHCVYCSNPIEMQNRERELPTESWVRAVRQAAEIGCYHVHFTGGEPLLRTDIEDLIAAARDAGLYTNLITSGLGLTERRLKALVEAGLDHIQLSVQDSEEERANDFAGSPAHRQKLRAAERIHHHRIAFTLNLVVHRENLDRLPELIAFAESLQPDKIEIANVQYYGWALKNRARLLPTGEQVERSLPLLAEAQQRLRGKIRIDFVLPDYYAKYPKPCMGGWGRGLMLIDPAGRVMPCHSAMVIPGMEFENCETNSLRRIWEESEAFNRFRGDAWMQEPCRSCERKATDFGGCRCQAFLLAGEAAATDPTCSKAPMRSMVAEILSQPGADDWVYRIDPVRP